MEVKVKKEWLNFSNRIKNINFDDFLNNTTIRQTMFFSDDQYNRKEYSFIKENIDSDSISKLTKISKIGNPNTVNYDGITLNGNIIHHLYHLSRYKNTTNKMLGKNILEWGGGYANMASIIMNLQDVDNYTIIDLPELIEVQKYFLGQIFGDENINVVDSNNYKFGKINLVPVSNIENIDYSIFDTFISNWAISESETLYHEFCETKSLFNLDNVLISYHLCGYHIPFMSESLNIDSIVKKNNLIVEEIGLTPGINYYAFK